MTRQRERDFPFPYSRVGEAGGLCTNGAKPTSALLNKLCGDYRHPPQQTSSILDIRIGRTTPTPGDLEAAERARAVPNVYRGPRQGDE